MSMPLYTVFVPLTRPIPFPAYRYLLAGTWIRVIKTNEEIKFEKTQRDSHELLQAVWVLIGF